VADETFELKQEHLTLLANAYVDWEDTETGAPAIDPKRPYGNSFVAGDIAEILGIEPEGDGFSQEQIDSMMELHRGTQTALQILISHATEFGFELGTYQRQGYTQYWHFA